MSEQGTCYIVGASDLTLRGLMPEVGDLLIAADGGLTACLAAGLRPDLLLGDFDSLPPDTSIPENVPVLRFPVRKDDTDTGIALAEGMQRGYRDFALYGCAGGRIDHELANLQSMARLSREGVRIRMVAPRYDVYALTDGTLVLPPLPMGATVSVFCHGECAKGVTLRGLSYPLTDATLSCDVPLGVSNQVASERCEVSVKEGTLLVFCYQA